MIQRSQEVEEYLLPPMEGNYRYTLVLDLDETLVHFQEMEQGGQFLVRPFAEDFLIRLSEYYEIVIFTAAMEDYADFILDKIDKKESIRHRLYRQHTTVQDGHSFKDLNRLGRDLSKTVIIDNNPENYQMQVENGIYIKSWYGEEDDQALKELLPLLVELVRHEVDDVRDGLRIYQDRLL